MQESGTFASCKYCHRAQVWRNAAECVARRGRPTAYGVSVAGGCGAVVGGCGAFNPRYRGASIFFMIPHSSFASAQSLTAKAPATASAAKGRAISAATGTRMALPIASSKE